MLLLLRTSVQSPCAFPTHGNVLDEELSWVAVSITAIQPPHRHGSNSGPWGHIRHRAIHAKQLPPEGMHGYVLSEFSAKPHGHYQTLQCSVTIIALADTLS